SYGMVEMNAPEMTAIVDISLQNLEDSGFDLAAEVQGEGELQFAVAEGLEVVSGTGVDQCEGILVNADIATDTSSGIGGGSATDLTTGDAVLQLSYNLKAGYAKNGTWVMNRKTLGKIRMLKDGLGQYIWQPGLQFGLPNAIDGAPYADMPDMPDVAAGAFPIAFGDFMRGYSLLDRIAMTLLRDPFTQAGNGAIRFWMRRRIGGRVTLAEAIRKLEIA
ncbi:MAG TPA: phage major capsid protein, partial [Caulobacteraceae bacterium]